MMMTTVGTHLSAMAPTMMAGVTMANMSWYVKYSATGTVGASTADGTAPTLYMRP